jgi:hypothetical protein
MKPLNLDNRPCSPISSNCVIYQGPDIPCIKLCTGDAVSDVIAKLGTELCTIMDQLNVTNYDLSCLDINACPPADFQALIQLLIDKICEANGVTVTPEKASGCPDCVVSVAPCFVQGNQTTMQLVDYVQMIANRVCSILDQINVINNQITNIDNRVTVLENTPPPTFTIPSIDTECLATYMGNVASAPIDQVLNTLLNNDTIGYCALIQATGLPAEILSAVASQCVSSSDPSLASESEGDSPVEPMSTYYNGTWINSAVTAADAINNLWISICDVRTYISNLTQSTTVVAAGENINVTSVTVGSTTTYTINNIGLDYFYAQVTIGGPNNCNTAPATIPNVVNAAGKTVGKGGNNYAADVLPSGPFYRVRDVLQYNYMDSNGTVVNVTGAPYGGGTEFIGSSSPASAAPSSTFLTIDNFTGVFRITKKGEYLITMSTYLKANGNNTAYWKTTGTDGRFDIGICSGGIFPNDAVNSGDIFTGASKSIVANMDSNIILTAQCVVQLPEDFQIIFRMLNLTGEDYAGGDYTGSDAIRVGFVKLRDL